MKKVISLILAALLCGQLLPLGILAAGDAQTCGHHAAHTADCGEPCSFVCPYCPIQANIDALPDPEGLTAVDTERMDAVLQAITDAVAAIPEENRGNIDLTRYNAVVEALAGKQGVPQAAAVGDTFEIDGLKYQVLSVESGKEAVEVVKNSYTGASYTIPDTVANNGVTYAVTSIGKEAFRGCSSLESITLGSKVETIGQLAFRECSKLTAITLPASVTTIGVSAFSKTGLTAVTIPDSVTTLGASAFYACTSLKTAVIGKNVKTIEADTFNICDELESITIPSGVTAIGDRAIAHGKKLTSFTIPDTVTSIGAEAFTKSAALKTVTIQYKDKLPTVAETAFAGCPADLQVKYETTSTSTVQVGQVALKPGEYTTDGKTAALGTPATGGYARFEGGVLTLHNFSYTGGGANNAVIHSNEDLTIQLSGTNSITSSEWFGIQAGASGKIQGSGTTDSLEVIVQSHKNHDITAIYGRSITIEKCTLTVKANETLEDATGLGAYDNLTITNAVVNAQAGKSTRGSSQGIVTLSSLSIKDSEVTAAAGDGIRSDGVNVGEGVTIENSTVNASAGANDTTDTAKLSIGITIGCSRGNTLTLTSGTIIASAAKTSGDSGALYLYQPSLVLPTEYWWRTVQTDTLTKGGYTGNGNDVTYLEITSVDPHVHNYTYTAQDNVLTESCDCGHSAAATVTAPTGTLVYNGTTEFKASVTYDAKWAGSRTTELTYSKGGTAPTVFTNAGEYTASLTVGNAKAELKYTVAKVKLTVTAADHTITYGDQPAGNGVTYSGFVNNETESVLGTENLSYTSTYARGDAASDTYTITPQGLTSENYEFEYKPGKLTVVPLEAVIQWSTLTADDLEYTGTAKVLTATVQNALTGDDVAFTLALTGDNVEITTDGFHYTVTGLTGLKAGSYKLGTELDSPTYKITKAIQDNVPWPTGLKGTAGEKLSTVALPERFAWEDGDKVLAVGENSVYVVYTPEDTTHYHRLKKTVKVTAAEQTYKVTSGADQTITKGNTAAFVVNIPYADNKSSFVIYVDGEKVASTKYTLAKSGTDSTKITLKSAYISSLKAGEYDLEIQCKYGSAYTEFTVKNRTTDSGTSRTGDTTHTALWLGMTLAGLLGLIATMLAKKHYRKRK